MSRTTRSLLLAFAYAGVLLLALLQQSWGALALLAAGGGGWAWYAVQVARSRAAEKASSAVAEDTRLPGLQDTTGEIPGQRPAPKPPAGRA